MLELVQVKMRLRLLNAVTREKVHFIKKKKDRAIRPTALTHGSHGGVCQCHMTSQRIVYKAHTVLLLG
jgi:hypothetical protein